MFDEISAILVEITEQISRSVPVHSPNVCPVQDGPDVYPLQDSPDVYPLQESPDVYPLQDSPDAYPLQDSPDVYPQQDSPDVYPLQDSPDVYPLLDSPDVYPLQDSQTSTLVTLAEEDKHCLAASEINNKYGNNLENLEVQNKIENKSLTVQVYADNSMTNNEYSGQHALRCNFTQAQTNNDLNQEMLPQIYTNSNDISTDLSFYNSDNSYANHETLKQSKNEPMGELDICIESKNRVTEHEYSRQHVPRNNCTHINNDLNHQKMSHQIYTNSNDISTDFPISYTNNETVVQNHEPMEELDINVESKNSSPDIFTNSDTSISYSPLVANIETSLLNHQKEIEDLPCEETTYFNESIVISPLPLTQNDQIMVSTCHKTTCISPLLLTLIQSECMVGKSSYNQIKSLITINDKSTDMQEVAASEATYVAASDDNASVSLVSNDVISTIIDSSNSYNSPTKEMSEMSNELFSSQDALSDVSVSETLSEDFQNKRNTYNKIEDNVSVSPEEMVIKNVLVSTLSCNKDFKNEMNTYNKIKENVSISPEETVIKNVSNEQSSLTLSSTFTEDFKNIHNKIEKNVSFSPKIGVNNEYNKQSGLTSTKDFKNENMSTSPEMVDKHVSNEKQSSLECAVPKLYNTTHSLKLDCEVAVTHIDRSVKSDYSALTPDAVTDINNINIEQNINQCSADYKILAEQKCTGNFSTQVKTLCGFEKSCFGELDVDMTLPDTQYSTDHEIIPEQKCTGNLSRQVKTLYDFEKKSCFDELDLTLPEAQSNLKLHQTQILQEKLEAEKVVLFSEGELKYTEKHNSKTVHKNEKPELACFNFAMHNSNNKSEGNKSICFRNDTSSRNNKLILGDIQVKYALDDHSEMSCWDNDVKVQAYQFYNEQDNNHIEQSQHSINSNIYRDSEWLENKIDWNCVLSPGKDEVSVRDELITNSIQQAAFQNEMMKVSNILPEEERVRGDCVLGDIDAIKTEFIIEDPELFDDAIIPETKKSYTENIPCGELVVKNTDLLFKTHSDISPDFNKELHPESYFEKESLVIKQTANFNDETEMFNKDAEPLSSSDKKDELNSSTKKDETLNNSDKKDKPLSNINKEDVPLNSSHKKKIPLNCVNSSDIKLKENCNTCSVKEKDKSAVNDHLDNLVQFNNKDRLIEEKSRELKRYDEYKLQNCAQRDSFIYELCDISPVNNHLDNLVQINNTDRPIDQQSRKLEGYDEKKFHNCTPSFTEEPCDISPDLIACAQIKSRIIPHYHNDDYTYTPDPSIEDDDNLSMFPATQCFKPTTDSSLDLIPKITSQCQYEEMYDDGVVPVSCKRNISEVYEASEESVKKGKINIYQPTMTSSCFQWNESTSSLSFNNDQVPVSSNTSGEDVNYIRPILTCSRPLRVGLSRKQRTPNLHRYSK